MARRDNSPVGNTCPYINRVISFIESVDVTDDNRSEIKNALEELEVIRSMNKELRDWGNEQYDLVCELESNERGYQADICCKDGEIDDLTSKVERLESEIEKLEDKMYELQN